MKAEIKVKLKICQLKISQDCIVDTYLRGSTLKDALKCIENLNSKIIQGFQQLRDNDLSCNSQQSMEVFMVPEEQPKVNTITDENV